MMNRTPLVLVTCLLSALGARGGSTDDSFDPDLYGDEIVGKTCKIYHINTALAGPYTICNLCPHSLHKPTCKDGYERSKAGACGPLKTWCKWKCTYTGKKSMDYGCGCGQGRRCHDVDCKMSKWTEWSKCVSFGYEEEGLCNSGGLPSAPYQERARTIITQPEYNGKKCGKTVASRGCSCSTPSMSPTLRPTRSPTTEEEWECKQYGDWSEWSECEWSKTVSSIKGECYGDRSRTRPVRDTSTAKCRKTATQRDPDFCKPDSCGQ